MPEPIAPPAPEDDQKISPLPPRGMRALDTVGRLVAGALICALGAGGIMFGIFLFFPKTDAWFLHLIASLWLFHQQKSIFKRPAHPFAG
jgi:hypothetical protein